MNTNKSDISSLSFDRLLRLAGDHYKKEKGQTERVEKILIIHHGWMELKTLE